MKEKKNHPWEYARCKVIIDIVKPFMDMNSESSNVLDIWCGDLFFLNQFCKEFPSFNAVAVDRAFDAELILSLKKKYQDLSVSIYKNIEDVRLNSGYANILFLLDVIEHIENDQEFLDSLSRQTYVTRNSLFVFTAPAFNSLFSEHDKWLGHYRRYSLIDLKTRITLAGFEYIRGGYFFCTLLLPRMIQKWSEIFFTNKRGKEVRGIGNWTGGNVAFFLYEKILLSDHFVSKLFWSIGITLPGLSTFILCKKR